MKISLKKYEIDMDSPSICHRAYPS